MNIDISNAHCGPRIHVPGPLLAEGRINFKDCSFVSRLFSTFYRRRDERNLYADESMWHIRSKWRCMYALLCVEHIFMNIYVSCERRSNVTYTIKMTMCVFIFVFTYFHEHLRVVWSLYCVYLREFSKVFYVFIIYYRRGMNFRARWTFNVCCYACVYFTHNTRRLKMRKRRCINKFIFVRRILCNVNVLRRGIALINKM